MDGHRTGCGGRRGHIRGDRLGRGCVCGSLTHGRNGHLRVGGRGRQQPLGRRRVAFRGGRHPRCIEGEFALVPEEVVLTCRKGRRKLLLVVVLGVQRNRVLLLLMSRVLILLGAWSHGRTTLRARTRRRRPRLAITRPRWRRRDDQQGSHRPSRSSSSGKREAGRGRRSAAAFSKPAKDVAARPDAGSGTVRKAQPAPCVRAQAELGGCLRGGRLRGLPLAQFPRAPRA